VHNIAGIPVLFSIYHYNVMSTVLDKRQRSCAPSNRHVLPDTGRDVDFILTAQADKQF